MKIKIPDKLYFKIGEVAKIAEVPTHVLRYWESEFPRIRPKRANSKQRLYRKQDVELIVEIKSLLHDRGYTIAGARKLIESTGIGPAEPQVPKEEGITPSGQLTQKLKTIIQELKSLQNLLTNKKE
jgi:DNA-binding transcriptional MerR regulator